jgi:hypothetical protein
VLLGLLRLGPEAYGAAVSLEIEQQTGRALSVSAVHATLDRLEDKRLIRSRLGEPTPQRGGKRKTALRSASGRGPGPAARTWLPAPHDRGPRRRARRRSVTPDYQRPPTLSRWLLRVLAPRRALDELAGDLLELFALRAKRAGRAAARRWYWRQVVRAYFDFNQMRRPVVSRSMAGGPLMLTLTRRNRHSPPSARRARASSCSSP